MHKAHSTHTGMFAFIGGMLKSIPFLVLLAVTIFAQDSAKYEAQVWSLERAYWEYVKANALEKYRALWHEDFLGWPFVSSAPTRKDHITDWITANTSKGRKLQSYSIEPLAIQLTGDVAINHYRIKATWATSDKAEARTDALRITHTWIRTDDTWADSRRHVGARKTKRVSSQRIICHLSLIATVRAAQTLQIFVFLILTSSFLLP